MNWDYWSLGWPVGESNYQTIATNATIIEYTPQQLDKNILRDCSASQIEQTKQTMAAKSFLNLAASSNARTNWVTIVLGAIIGVLSFFKIIPDLNIAQNLGKDVADIITYATIGAWTSVFAVALNLYNTISHLLKRE